MQRVLSFVAALSIAVLAPTPVSVCALLASQMAQCETAKTQMQCAETHMQKDARDAISHNFAFCHPAVECCATNQTQATERQYGLEQPLIPIASGKPAAVGAHFVFYRQIATLRLQHLSSANRQSLLCVFLI